MKDRQAGRHRFELTYTCLNTKIVSGRQTNLKMQSFRHFTIHQRLGIDSVHGK